MINPLANLALQKVALDRLKEKEVVQEAANRMAASAVNRTAGTFSAGGGGGSPVDTWQDRLLGNQQAETPATGSIWSRDPAEVPEPSEALKSSTNDRAVILEAALNRLRGRTQATRATQAGAPVEELEEDDRFTAGQRRSAEAKARWEVMDKWQSADGSNLSLADQSRYQADVDNIPQRTQELLEEMERKANEPQQAAEPAESRSIWAKNAENVPASQISSSSRKTVTEAAMDRLKSGTMDLTGKDPYTTAERRSAEQQARWEVMDKWKRDSADGLSPADQIRYNADMDRIPQRAKEILAENRRKEQEKQDAVSLAQQQRKYGDLMDAQKAKSWDNATPEQRAEAEAKVDAQLNWEDLVATYGNEDKALTFYGEALDRNLKEIVARDRAKEIEDLKAGNPQAAEVYDYVNRPERLEKVFNPFSDRAELEADLEAAQGYQPQGWADKSVNGALANKTAESIQRRLNYIDDPEAAMADVQADIERLKEIKAEGSYDPDKVQSLIWQQERQLKLLEGYAAAKADTDGSLATKGKEAFVAGLNEQEKLYAGTYGITGGTSALADPSEGTGIKDIYERQTAINLVKGYNLNPTLEKLAMMTTEEQNAYFTLLGSGRKADAAAYLDGMANVIGAREQDIKETARNRMSEKSPVLWGMAEEAESLGLELAKPIASASVVGQQLTGKEIQQYGWERTAATQGDLNAERTKNAIGKAMTDKGYSEEQVSLAQSIYGVLHNAATNVSRGAASTAMGIPSVLSTVLMAFGTIAPTYYNLSDSTVGTGQSQRMITAAGDAVSEFLTEALSDAHMFEAFKTGFGVSGSGSWWQKAANATWQIIAGGTIESGTEVLNDIMSNAWHNEMLGQESEANRRLDAYYRMALAGDYKNNPNGAMQWAQQMAYKDTMAGYLETAWTSFASGGLMDIGGRTVNWMRQAPIRKEKRALSHYQFQEGSMGTGLTGNSEVAGKYATVDDAVFVPEVPVYNPDYVPTDPQFWRRPPRAGIRVVGIREATEGAPSGLRSRWETGPAIKDWDQYYYAHEIEDGDVMRDPKYRPFFQWLEGDQMENSVDLRDLGLEGRYHYGEIDGQLGRVYNNTPVRDENGINHVPSNGIFVPAGIKAGDFTSRADLLAQPGVRELTTEDEYYGAQTRNRLTDTYEKWTGNKIGEETREPARQPVPKPETDTRTQERPAEQAQDAVQLRDAMEAESAGITQPAGTRLQRQPEETQGPDARQPAPRPVSGYETLEQQEDQLTARPEDQAQPRDTGSTEAAAIAQPQTTGTVQTGITEDTRAPARRPGPIVRDEETVDVREDTPNRPAVQAAADVIRDERTADGVAEVLMERTASEAPADDAEGKADVYLMGGAYEDGLRGEGQTPFGGVYTFDSKRRALLDAAYEKGLADREERMKEIRAKNTEIANQSGFRDGADNPTHTNGVNLEGVTNELTNWQRVELGILDQMGKLFGVDFRIYDTLGGKNALYRKGSGQVDISLDADGSLIKAASHELYHYIEEWDAGAASKIRDLVLKYLENAEGYDLETRIQEIKAAYITKGEGEVDAVSEIVADSMLDMLADDDALVAGAIYADMENAGSIWQKAADHIKRISDFLKGQMDKLRGKSPEIDALADQADYVEAVAKLLRKTVQEATTTRRQRTYSQEQYTDPMGLIDGYYESLESTMTAEAARNSLTDHILKLMVGLDGNPLHFSKTEGLQRMGQAFRDYTTGQKSMAKALEDQGIRSTGEDLTRVAVFAAREAERQTQAQGKQTGAYTPSIHYDDDFDAMARAGQTYGGVDEDHEAHLILQKIFDLTKRGKAWTTDDESLQPGQWAAGLADMVNEIISQTGTRVGANRITSELRAMYTALDEALLRGEDFGISQAVGYARRIAEMIAEKAGTRIDLEDDALTGLVRSLRGKTIYLDAAQADEARAKYGTIRNLNKAYYGLVSFRATGKATAGSVMLEDLQTEDGVLFGTDTNAADLFQRFEDLMDQYRQQQAGAVDYNGMSRTEFERDLALRLIGGYFTLDGGMVAQTANKTQAKTSGEKRYVAAVRQLRTEYNRRTRELEAEYQRKTADAVNMADAEIEEAKRDFEAAKKRIISAYEYQIEKTAEALGTPLSAETRMRLLAGMDLEEASMAYLQMRQRIEAEIERRANERAERLAKAVTRGEISGKAKEEVNKRVQRWREAGARSALRKGIERTLNDFEQKLTRPTDKKHAPESMRLAFARVLGLVNTGNPLYPTGYRTQHWQGIQNYLTVSGLIDQYSDDVAATWDENLQANLRWLQEHAAGKSYMQMSLEELRTLNETLTAIKHTFDHYDEMLTEGQNQRVSEIAEPLNEEAMQAQADGRAQRHRDGIAGRIWQQLQGSWMDPVRWRNWADRMCGRGFGTRIHGMLRDGQDKQIRGVQEAEKRFKAWLSGVSKKDLQAMHGKKAGTISIMHGDDEVRMTRGQAMSLYMLMKRPQAVGHILGTEIRSEETGEVIARAGGGLSIKAEQSRDGQVGTTAPVTLTEAEVNGILDQLTPAEKALADRSREILDWCSDLGNEISMKMYGYKKYTEANYFPISTDSHYTSVTKTDNESNPLYRLKNQGFTKDLTVNANSPLMLEDMFDTIRDHVVGMINYNAWVIPVTDINRILNWKLQQETEVNDIPVRKVLSTTSQAMDILMGENGMKYIKQLLTDINGISKDQTEEKAALLNMLSKFKGAAVAFNLSTAMKQPWSVTRAWATIGVNYFTPGRLKGCTGDVTELMKDYAPIYVWKQYGNFTLDLGKSMDQIFYPQMDDGLMGWINDKSMALPGWADNKTWEKIWRAAEKKTAHDHPDLAVGSDAFYKAVALEFRECIDQTQVVDGILQRTEAMRSKGIMAKMATSFMGEPMKSFNLLADAVEAVGQTEKGTDEHREALRSAATNALVYGVSGLTMSMVSSFVSAFRHWDADKPWEETFMEYLLGFSDWDEFKKQKAFDKIKTIVGSNVFSEFSVLNKLPYLRDIITMIQGYDLERSDMSLLANAWNDCWKLYYAIQGTTKVGVGKAAANVVNDIGALLGVPVGNLFKEFAYLSNGLALGAQQIAGKNTFEWQYYNMQYNLNMDYSSNINTYIGLMYRAEMYGDTATSDKIRHDLMATTLDPGAMENKINKRLAKLYQAGAAEPAQEYADLLAAGKKTEAEQLRTGYRGGKETFDGAVADMIQLDAAVAEANAARKAGDLQPMQDLIKRYRTQGFDDATIYKAINRQYNETQDEDDRVTVTAGSMWLARDLNEAIDRGDMDDIRYIVKWMQDEGGKKTSTIKSGVTKAYKQAYIDAVQGGDDLYARQLMQTLLNCGLGYTEKEIKGWLKK